MEEGTLLQLPILTHFKIVNKPKNKSRDEEKMELDASSTGITIESASYFHLVTDAKPVAQWTVNEVFEWAKTIVKEDHAKKLKDQKVAGQALLTLTKEKLAKKPYKVLRGPATKLEIAIKASRPLQVLFEPLP
jgi:hypothetical protein